MKHKASLLAFTLLAGSVMISSHAFAASPYTCAAGTECIIGTAGAAADPATISYRPSPGVTAKIASTASAFAINTLNTTAATSKNGIEYLVISSDPGYYQKENNATITAIATPDASVDGYTYIGTTEKSGT